MGLLSALILFSSLSFNLKADELPCSSLFFERPLITNPLAHAFPAAIEKGAIEERVQKLFELWPNHVKMVDDVIVKVDTPAGVMEKKKRFIVMSFDGLSDKKIAELKDDYVRLLSSEVVSIPMGKGSGHLYTRIGNKVFDHQLDAFKSTDYEFSLYSPRMETLISLSEKEFDHLRWYVHSIEHNYGRTIGSFSIDGPMEAEGKLDKNPGANGCAHNCTTWLTLAPIGEEGQTLKSLVKGKHYDIHRDPGWWSLYLQTKSPDERSPFVVFMEDKSWAELDALIAPNKEFQWSYNLAK